MSAVSNNEIKQIVDLFEKTKLLVDQPALLNEVDAKIQAMMKDAKFADIYSELQNAGSLIARIKETQVKKANADVKLECLVVHNLILTILNGGFKNDVLPVYGQDIFMNIISHAKKSSRKLKDYFIRERININGCVLLNRPTPLIFYLINELGNDQKISEKRLNAIMDIFLNAGLDVNRFFFNGHKGKNFSLISGIAMLSIPYSRITIIFNKIFKAGGNINYLPSIPNYQTTHQLIAQAHPEAISKDLFKFYIKEGGLDVNLQYCLAGNSQQVNFLENLLYQPQPNSERIRLAVYYGAKIKKDQNQANPKKENQDLIQALDIRKEVIGRHLAQMPDQLPNDLKGIIFDYHLGDLEVGDLCCQEEEVKKQTAVAQK